MKGITLKVNRTDYNRIIAGLESRRGSFCNYYNIDKSKNKNVSRPMLREAKRIDNLINNLRGQR